MYEFRAQKHDDNDNNIIMLTRASIHQNNRARCTAGPRDAPSPVAVLVGVVAFVPTFVRAARDVTASMYTHLANHLTPQECLSLVAYLYATGLGPTAVKQLEQHLPATESCLSLLTTWNNGDGKDKSFLSVADGVRKIGRDELAEWWSDTVFTQLSMEMKSCFLQNTTRVKNNTSATATVPSRSWRNRSKSKTASCTSDKTLLFLLFDTICMYFVLMAIVTLVFYSLGLLVRVVKESQHVRTMHKRKYKILEIGILPQDLDSEDEILDPFC